MRPEAEAGALSLKVLLRSSLTAGVERIVADSVTEATLGKGMGACLLLVVVLAGCADVQPLVPPEPLPNQPPVVSGELPPQRLEGPGETAALDVAGYFADPDGDALAFEAASSDTAVVAVSTAGSVLTLTAGATGGATRVTVTARDPDGAEANGSFSVTVIESPDRAALVALYNATGGSNWTRGDNWLTDAPLNEWYGVFANQGYVLGLNLRDNALIGRIPPELGNLEYMERLTLGENALTGPIPTELGNLVNLRTLALGYGLTGPIPPELGKLVNLEWLGLTGGLTGPIPPELGDLVNLRTLALGGELTGPIPPELGKLVSLESLDLGGNELTGPIPPELGDLVNLRTLALGDGLTGPIPPELGKLVNLEVLGLTGGLTGPIPPELGDLVNLEQLWLTPPLCCLDLDGELTGRIPLELGNLVNLRELTLWLNELTGPIPPELGNLVNLEWLALSGNALTGPIPPELGNLVNLYSLKMDDNALTGPVPPELANLVNLEQLGLSDGHCVPSDPGLRAWLLKRGWPLFPCGIASDSRLLPRALMREDGNGLSLALPDDLPRPLSVAVSNPAVVAATLIDRWLVVTPVGRGSAEVEVVLSGGGPPAMAGVAVRRAVGTFGIDIALDQPAPIGYEEVLLHAADWWSSVLDGTEWPDRPPCGSTGRTGVWATDPDPPTLADEVYIEAGVSTDGTAVRVCYGPKVNRGGRVTPGEGNGVIWEAGDVDEVRRRIGFILGVPWGLRDASLLTPDSLYFTGVRAVAEYRGGGGDAGLPGVPMQQPNILRWDRDLVDRELMTSHYDDVLSEIDMPDAVTLGALADQGYTVDMTKATPWRAPGALPADSAAAAKRLLLIGQIVIERVPSRGGLRR